MIAKESIDLNNKQEKEDVLTNEEDDYNEEEDEDFDPSKKELINNEPSEEENDEYVSSEDEKTNVDYSNITSDVGGFIKTRKARQLEEENRKKHKYESLDVSTISDNANSIWEELKKDANNRLQNSLSNNSKSVIADPNSTDIGQDTNDELNEELIWIERSYKFAGEMIHERKQVPRSSAAAQEYLNNLKFDSNKTPNEKVATPSVKVNEAKPTEVEKQLRRPLKRPSILEQIISGTLKPKLTTLEKSQMDWATYVDKEGINDELTLHNKDGYLAKQDFLNRVEMNEDEKYKAFRQKQLALELQEQKK
ncbi:hypothetical protein TBLA_0A01520 [Henningerozyma blattae CBS 6284]|uniref:SWR1-complex protein 5 n=1 Tax=Henningerozyma blattae (strain ATCC 34711 / CBS 6284 / DSM 70876 / NBRC 10599 / NRRL Y-10934 / UCD 77-7) TaxID=1071380 RepID=I2GUZ9_HENB6|nr:hypothetical protein TBLA_0A01520 [Tetrapisispora blattae CBS 6284]CCH57951.1 hypothetical protein TBLA_0A01520 [Tetrapisispora blattae CBS 6284]